MKIIVVENGQSYFAEVQNIKGVIWIHHQGRTFVYESDAKSKRSRSKTAAATGLMVAPMPGKVTRVLKTAGDQVKSGDLILVMEAMKMEYTLKSHIDGVVKSVDCKVGEQVPLGKQLALIEAAV